MLALYKHQQIVERRHRDYKQTLKVRPIFLHNDDRIYALTSIVGLALLIFGLIESQTRQALADDEPCQACCPKAAPPSPPDATSSPPSKASVSPTPPTASASTASPTPSAESSSYCKSLCHGPSRNR